ncbi:flagellin [Devosia sp. SD17-2]|uniref:flagellin n=1 Tax=Devosia sp. SD17-2 TaxID=2976459 RepID=UPI0023D8245F|nr:flagellin [Devosia sp. SD17-2]WEJ34823.1 flagellin [Devosia sp. SD17-2]
MSAVNLSSSARSGLSVLRSVADQMEVTQKRLATGKAVNSAVDNASRFFSASKMDARAASIDNLMEGVTVAQTTLKAAGEGIKGIQGVIKQARALTGQALASDTATRKVLAEQFNTLAAEVTKLVADSKVNGSNLLAGNSISVVLNEDGTSKVDIAGFSITTFDDAENNWATVDDITASVDALTTLSTDLETDAAKFGSSQSLIDVRKDFNAALSNLLKSGSNDLTAADMDQEAANLMALQTRQQMAATALSIMQSSESTALRLLR